MRRFLLLAVLAASLLPLPGPARAQATADQLNKLSLEALTARPAGGGGDYVRRSYRPAYRPSYRPAYRRAYHASYHRAARTVVYTRHSHRYVRRYVATRFSMPGRTVYRAPIAVRARRPVHYSTRVRPTAYHPSRHR